MSNRFRTLDLALKLYQETRELTWPAVEGDQFRRAVVSIVLNLKEGSSRPSAKDRRRFYSIALGSLREVQALFEMTGKSEWLRQADTLGAHLYRLYTRT